MASFRQHGNGWQARIRRQGHPDITKTFEARQDAEKWARAVESSIDKGQFIDINEALRTTLGDVIERYLAEVTPTMKSAVADTIRLRALMRRPVAKLSMANLSAVRVAAFRDERLKQVSAGTVIRELAYLSAIINHARREWGIHVPNPGQMVRKPSSPQPGRGCGAMRKFRGYYMPLSLWVEEVTGPSLPSGLLWLPLCAVGSCFHCAGSMSICRPGLPAFQIPKMATLAQCRGPQRRWKSRRNCQGTPTALCSL